MSAKHEVRFFEADCRHCRRGFPIPLLGDFSYGSFVLNGEGGGVFGYLSAFDCPAWKEIESRMLLISGLREFKSRADIERFQSVIAGCADEIEGQSLRLEFVCPFCRSLSVDYGDNKPLFVGEIRDVTFTSFQSLDDSAKAELLAKLWKR